MPEICRNGNKSTFRQNIGNSSKIWWQLKPHTQFPSYHEIMSYRTHTHISILAKAQIFNHLSRDREHDEDDVDRCRHTPME